MWITKNLKEFKFNKKVKWIKKNSYINPVTYLFNKTKNE